MAGNREKIIRASLDLFNRFGFVNVRLQHISDESIVSLGNIAYHFKNKEAIVLHLYQLLEEKQKALLAQHRVLPLFEYIDDIFEQSYALQSEFIFFYQDTLEIMRTYPQIADMHRQHISYQVQQLVLMLDFNVARGALLDSCIGDSRKKLANNLWAHMDFWRTMQAVRGFDEHETDAYQASVWSLLMPHFTTMGLQEYRQMLALKAK